MRHTEQRRDWWARTWNSDELVLASVLGTHFIDELTQTNPGYTEWSGGGAHPATFGVGDVARIASIADRWTDQPPGRKWFARKFDDEDGHVKENLDRLLLP